MAARAAQSEGQRGTAGEYVNGPTITTMALGVEPPGGRWKPRALRPRGHPRSGVGFHG